MPNYEEFSKPPPLPEESKPKVPKEIVNEENKEESVKREGNIENAERRNELLESIAKRGRYALYGYMMPEVGNKIISGISNGWGTIGSKNFNSNRNLSEGQELLKIFSIARNVLKEMNVEAAIYIEPIIKKEKIYIEEKKEVEIPGKGWFSKAKKEIRVEQKLVGETEVQQKINEFNGDNTDESNASRLGISLSCTKDKSWPVLANRPGGYMLVSLILPEALAESAYNEIQKDPRFLTQILEKMEPGLLSELKIPEKIKNFEKILIVPKLLKPENMVDIEMVPIEGPKAKGLKPEYNTPEFVREVK